VTLKPLRSLGEQPNEQTRVASTASPMKSSDSILNWGRIVMATYDLEEQEQIAEMKAWWKQYGNLLTGVVTAASIRVCRLARLELVSA
jgi:hypothetical protein